MSPRKIGIYGPGVIGQKQFEAEQEIVRTKSNIYGPGVLDKHPANRKLEKAKERLRSAQEALEQAGSETARKKAAERLQAAREAVAEARQNLKARGTGRRTENTEEAVEKSPSSSEVSDRVNRSEDPPEHPSDTGAALRPLEPNADVLAQAGIEDMTVDELEEYLHNNPSATTYALRVEKDRDTPRVTALKAILAAEVARPGGPREVVTKQVEAVLDEQ